MAGAPSMTAEEFAAYVAQHGKLTGASPIIGDPTGASTLTFSDGTEINAVENPDGSVNITKYVKNAPAAKAATQVGTNTRDQFIVDSTGKQTPNPNYVAPPTPAADQTVPGSGTPASPGSLGSPLADGPDPSMGWSPETAATPDLTVPAYNAETARTNATTAAGNAANTAANDAAGRQIQSTSAALAQKDFEFRQGQAIIANHLAEGRLTLDQAKQAADMLYQEADLQLRRQIADTNQQGQQLDFGSKMAQLGMQGNAPGTAAALAPMWAGAAKGNFVAPNLSGIQPRDPTQIALQAIAAYKASLGPGSATPSATAPGLTLPAAPAAPASIPVAPMQPPQFPFSANGLHP